MNASDRSTPSAGPASVVKGPARLYYFDPVSLPDPADPTPALRNAVRMGFDAVAIPPPWAPGADGNRLLPATFDRVQDKLGGGLASAYLNHLAGQCLEHGLRLVLDVDLSRVSPDFDGGAPAFDAPPPLKRLDPRHAATPRVRTAHRDAAAAAWWGGLAAGWAMNGVAGLRLLGLGDVDAAAIIAAIRSAAPGMMLIAWTPGLPEAGLTALQGVDYVVSSLPWWDGEAEWLWLEYARLRRIAPVLCCPEAPFGARAAASINSPQLLLPHLRLLANLAWAIGDGWMMPAGFETGVRRAMTIHPAPSGWSDGPVDLSAEIASLNTLPLQASGGMRLLSGPGADVLVLLSTDTPDPRFARAASLSLVNLDEARPRTLDAGLAMSRIDGHFGPFRRPGTDAVLASGDAATLPPGGLLVYHAEAAATDAQHPPIAAEDASRFAAGPRVAIENPAPCVDDGALPVKRPVGEVVAVEVDVICDGHDKLAVALVWRGPGDQTWHEKRMHPIGNDRYAADLPLTRLGAWKYTIRAWRDAFATFRDELAKKSAAGIPVGLELREGLALVAAAEKRAPGPLKPALTSVVGQLAAADDSIRLPLLLSPEMAALMLQADDRPRAAALNHAVRVDAERSGAGFAAWYEVFPRSMSDDPSRHGTFADVERHLPRIAAMGFDVLYFPPVSPIGLKNRKGRNNTLTPAVDDPGSPYAIGSADGGHDALHPELGTFEDFRHLVAEAASHGLEIAIDFAIQCSPDHPWLKDHPGWFSWRPDGTIKYAENPPKRYEDIVNVDFYADGAIPGLWVALANVVLFWCEQGIRLFRVDNPHTKPFPFWQWMIGEVRTRYPDAVFLAEAFTRPKVMYRLAKVGFSQSYTYFTWRETKREMEAYLTELSLPGPRDFFRPHFFVNTPDINPVYLQGAPRSAYLIRAALAATLSGLWGLYNGFELCEGTPVPGKEEYLDSEKYQLRAWDWNRPGNIIAEVTALNRIRRMNPALRTHLNAVFLDAANDAVTVFEKATPDRSNVLVVAVSFDPSQPQETGFEFPFWHWQATEATAFIAENLVTGARETWRGKYQSARFTPDQPYAIWRVRAAL